MAKIALAQVSAGDDREKNREDAISLVRKAASQGAELILFLNSERIRNFMIGLRM